MEERCIEEIIELMINELILFLNKNNKHSPVYYKITESFVKGDDIKDDIYEIFNLRIYKNDNLIESEYISTKIFTYNNVKVLDLFSIKSISFINFDYSNNEITILFDDGYIKIEY